MPAGFFFDRSIFNFDNWMEKFVLKPSIFSCNSCPLTQAPRINSFKKSDWKAHFSYNLSIHTTKDITKAYFSLFRHKSIVKATYQVYTMYNSMKI